MLLKAQYLVHFYLTLYICDLFFIDRSSDIAKYAEDASPYECTPYYDRLKENLELSIYKIFNWFKYNNFETNTTK